MCIRGGRRNLRGSTNLRSVLLLAIPGSLRAGSTHHAILEAARHLAPDGVTVETYHGVGDLPHFDSDLETAGPPPVVAALRALDWLVGSTELPGKPVALLGVAGRAEHATAQLEEVLTTMSARLVRAACVRLPLSGPTSAAAIVGDRARAEPLRAAVATLADAAAR